MRKTLRDLGKADLIFAVYQTNRW